MKRDDGDVGRSLGRLVERFDLPAGADGQLAGLLSALTEDQYAPTTVRDPRRALDDHLADSLVAVEVPEVRAAASLADLGAGAGVPGLPLAVALPAAQVVLVESNGRKCEFIARASAAAGLTNTSVVAARAEAWPDGLDRFDVVTARALAPLPVVAEYAAPLLKVGGALLAWRGRPDPDEDAAGQAAAAQLGLSYAAPWRVRPYPGAVHRHLQLLVKTSATPSSFPRRPGMARKRPLGAPVRPSSDRSQR